MSITARHRWQGPVAVLAAAFGLATIAAGGRMIFATGGATPAAGNAVPFVLWFNFLAGFAYLAAAAALWTGHRLAGPLALAIGLATLAVFGLFGLAVWTGTPYEMRTVGAMALRTGFWLSVAAALRPMSQR